MKNVGLKLNRMMLRTVQQTTSIRICLPVVGNILMELVVVNAMPAACTLREVETIYLSS